MIKKIIFVLMGIVAVTMIGACKKGWNCECRVFETKYVSTYNNVTESYAILECNELDVQAKIFDESGGCELKLNKKR
jgi:hypothetical protein